MGQRREGHTEAEAEIGARLPQAKEHLEPPEAGEAKKDAPLEPPGEAGSCRNLDLRLLAFRTLRV